MLVLNTSLRPSGHPEHDEYRIGRDYLVSDTGNGGETSYCLMRRTTEFPPAWDMDEWRHVAYAPSLEEAVRAYERIAS